MDLTLEEYLEYIRSLLEQAEKDGFEVEWSKFKVNLNEKSTLPALAV